MVLKEQRSHVCLWGVHYEQRLSWGLETRVMKNIIYIDHKRHWQVAENHDFSCVYPIKYIKKKKSIYLTFLVTQTLKNLPAVQETQVWSLGWEDPLKKGMTIHSSILSWRIPQTEEPGGLQSMGLQRVGHDRATHTHTHECCISTKNLLNSVMRTLICLHFWISRHLLKLTFLESSKNPQALTSHRDALWRIHMFVWDWGGPLTVAQGLFVHQFRKSGEGQDQRVYTYFSMLQLGCYHYWTTFWNWTWKMFSPSKNYQLYITLYNPISSLLHMHCIGLPGLTWVCDHTLIDFYEKMYLEFQTADL